MPSVRVLWVAACILFVGVIASIPLHLTGIVAIGNSLAVLSALGVAFTLFHSIRETHQREKREQQQEQVTFTASVEDARPKVTIRLLDKAITEIRPQIHIRLYNAGRKVHLEEIQVIGRRRNKEYVAGRHKCDRWLDRYETLRTDMRVPYLEPDEDGFEYPVLNILRVIHGNGEELDVLCPHMIHTVSRVHLMANARMEREGVKEI